MRSPRLNQKTFLIFKAFAKRQSSINLISWYNMRSVNSRHTLIAYNILPCHSHGAASRRNYNDRDEKKMDRTTADSVNNDNCNSKLTSGTTIK